ncbi:MAG: ABC transporter ATP-binding protein [Desulfatiglandaceae bacterium]
MSLLEVKGIDVYYGDVQIIFGLSLEVADGSVVSIIGSNGAGKSTTLKTISALLVPKKGEIRFNGDVVSTLKSSEVVERGVIHIPEGRRLFPLMTVMENLQIGAFPKRAQGKEDETLRLVFALFPVLSERANQLASTLSGGEQQMLAIGRALMSNPLLLMLDEPSLGLAPILIKGIFETVIEINKRGTTILLVEQDVKHSLSISNYAYVLENGRLAMEGEGEALLEDKHVKKAYLGI